MNIVSKKNEIKYKQKQKRWNVRACVCKLILLFLLFFSEWSVNMHFNFPFFPPDHVLQNEYRQKSILQFC